MGKFAFDFKKHLNMRTRRKKHRGFTLVEMIVTMMVLSIMLGLTVSGLISWQDWANFNKENEYAQTLFIAAQNQLVEFAADGRLKEMQAEFEGEQDILNVNTQQYTKVGLNLTANINKLKDNQGNAYDLGKIFPDSVGSDGQAKTNASLYQGEIVSLRAEAGDYAKYLANPNKLKKDDPEAYWLFELIGAYVYDTSILNGTKNSDGTESGVAICVEITPADGQVFSVLYSDKNKKFIYQGVPGDKKASSLSNGVVDIANRNEGVRMDNMIGYYGVDTLSVATKNEVVRPTITSVKLYNKDTFYMTYRISSKYRQVLTSQLTYVMDLNPTKNVNDKLLTITLDGSKLKNEENATKIDCPVSVYEEDGTEVELGVFPVLAWVEEDYAVHVVLDAADIQATTDLYENELDEIRDTAKVADTDFAKTYSFFRFGVMSDHLYASVTAKGDKFGTAPTVSNFGNLNVLKNQSSKHPVFAGGTMKTLENGKDDYEYSLVNARHLYNIRYIEDLSYVKEMGSLEKADQVNGVTFEVKSNIDWAQFEEDEQLYNSYGEMNLSSLDGHLVDANGNTKETVTVKNCSFPSISQLRARDSIVGNDKTISGIQVSEIANALYGIYIKPGTVDKFADAPVGMININYGTISNLNMDKTVATGSNIVGGFCGINAGELKDLKMLNTDKKSRISGRKNVGGIMGFQLPTKDDTVIEKLENNASVQGVEAVGGILGMVRNNYDMITLSELTGLEPAVYNQLVSNQIFGVTIRECENYGFVQGVGSAELKGVYSSNNTPAPTRPAEIEARYIGGIVGYSYNSQLDDTDKIRIEECTSSPQMDDETLMAIVSDEDALKAKLKGAYVGGIVGYNHYGQINACSTKSKRGQEGYLFGYQYVGGIIGFNIGPADGKGLSGFGKNSENTNHVIANSYAGGIVGCNSGVKDKDSENNDISDAAKKDPEQLVGLLVPDQERRLTAKIDNWVNKGIVIALEEYSGGITGYNTGHIYRCNSKVESNVANKYFAQIQPGDYAGGIAGYNNGILGNSEREITKGETESKVVKKGDRFSTVCYVQGNNYVGGIVGYNDVDAVVEDYAISGGYVRGNVDSCFVGGYAGFNSSIFLLQDEEGEAIYIESNPNEVKGHYFVGGTVGGNIVNTNGYKGATTTEEPVTTESTTSQEPTTEPTTEQPTKPDKPEVDTKDGYASMDYQAGSNIWQNYDGSFSTNIMVTVHNNTASDIYNWKVDMQCQYDFEIMGWGSHCNYNSDARYIYASDNGRSEWSTNLIKANSSRSLGFTITAASKEIIEYIVANNWPVSFESDSLSQSGNRLAARGEMQNSLQQLGAADEQLGNVQVTLNTQWKQGDLYYGKYILLVEKNIEEKPGINWKIQIRVPDGARINSVASVNAELDEEKNLLTLTMPDYGVWHPVTPNTPFAIEVQLIYDSAAKVEQFLTSPIRLFFEDEKFYQNGEFEDDDPPVIPPTDDDPPVDPPVDPVDPLVSKYISTKFKTDNFLGQMKGDVFVGGFVGFNALISDKDPKAAVKVEKALVEKLNSSDQNAKKLADKIKIVDAILADTNTNPSKLGLLISGDGDDVETHNTFGMIEAQLYVGGVIGYNDEETPLYVKNVMNTTPITASKAIRYDSEQPDRNINYAGEEMEYTYSYIGGIMGKVSQNTIIDHCGNTPSGAVTSKGTYIGGLCEINEGVIKRCDVSNFGNSITEYVGGLCGLNKPTGLITECGINNRTVSGQNMVGAIACENFGTISDITVNKARMLVDGKKDQGNYGVVGVYAAFNGGVLRVQHNLDNVAISSGGNYVGGLVGINEGLIENNLDLAEGGNAANIVITGFVTGYNDVGGFIGLNQDKNPEHIIQGYTNEATVTATHGGAGGIVGVNASNNVIQYCENRGHVAATDAGNAGGIASSNANLIQYCSNYKPVVATKGLCGGIAAKNEESGVISECLVGPEEQNANITFTSTKSVGAIAATNAGLIRKNTLRNVIVQNDTSTMTSSVGVLIGDNLKTGVIEIYGADQDIVENCVVNVRSNYSNAGGVAGTNAGTIRGVINPDTNTSDAVVNSNVVMQEATVANIGGIAGSNTGMINDIQVDADLVGKLGSGTTGYGGIAGFSGTTLTQGLTKSGASGADVYSACIINCSYDGNLSAPGAAGATARIGGIVGINGHDSQIVDCAIGVRETNVAGQAAKNTTITSGDTSKTYTAPDKNAYAFIGGIAGENYGNIQDIDLARKTKDTVKIISFAGDAGGIAGSAYAGSSVGGSGYIEATGETKYLTTSPLMSVDMRAGENDHGAGGIYGYNRSGSDLLYIKNYADVTNMYTTNVKAGGIGGAFEVRETSSILFDHVYNYGKITTSRDGGGIAGRLKFVAADFIDCYNYGDVSTITHFAGGLVGGIYEAVVDCHFTNCQNHGHIYSTSTSKDGVGGFVGALASKGLGTERHQFYNCVNTGIVEKQDENGNAIFFNKVGSFVGDGSNATWIIDYCRNYNTNNTANGFVAYSGTVHIKDSLDNSGVTATSSVKNLPFGGTLNSAQNLYYLNNNNSSFDKDSHDTYFLISRGSNSAFNMRDKKFTKLCRPDLYLNEPSTSIGVNTGTKTDATLEFSMSYGNNSPGMEAFIAYLWNGATAESTVVRQNNAEAEFTDVYGRKGVATVENANAGYELADSKVVFKVPEGLDPQIKTIRVKFTNLNDQAVCLRGFTWKPVGCNESVCTYLGEKYDTTFAISSINNGSAEVKLNLTMPKGETATHFIGDTFYSEVFNVDWSPYMNMNFEREAATSKGSITIDVNNGENASGMNAFVIYFANNNADKNLASKDIRTYKYQYRVAFVDMNGKKVYATHTDANGNETDLFETFGMDCSVKEQAGVAESDYRSRSRAQINVPVKDIADRKVSKVIIEVNDVAYTTTSAAGVVSAENHTDKKIYIRDFAWMPVGSVESKLACADYSSNTENIYAYNKTGYYTKLNVDYKAKGTKERPYVYSTIDRNVGFLMDGNDPINDSYYQDHSSYEESKQVEKNSRIKVYEDIDPKFASILAAQYLNEYKLAAPTNLKVETKSGMYNFTWTGVQKASQYEIYYILRDENNVEVERSDSELVGTLECAYRLQINKEWVAKNYKIEFYIRSVNAYRRLHDGDTKYDSDWVSTAGGKVKEVLIVPQIHIEVTPDNEIMAVLDNREDYVVKSENGNVADDAGKKQYLDCTVNVVYDQRGKMYEFNIPVKETRFSPERYVNTIENKDPVIIAHTIPNESIADRYVQSRDYIKAGRFSSSSKLTTSDRYPKETTFIGFKGSVPEEMTYTVCLTAEDIDSYMTMDISAYDEKIGAEVAYSSETAHIAATSGSAKFVSELSNIPTEWFKEDFKKDIVARAYLYRSQYDIVYYGHLVAENIVLNGKTPADNRRLLDEQKVMDPYFLGDNDIQKNVSIFNEDGSLKDGYVIYKKYTESGDVYYDIYYNVTIDMAKKNARIVNDLNKDKVPVLYSKYAVDYMYLDSAENRVNTVDYQESYYAKNLTNKTMQTENLLVNDPKVIQEIQPAPVVDGNIQATQDAETGKINYTIYWDTFFRNKKCWNNGLNPVTQANTINGYKWYQSTTAAYQFDNEDKGIAKTWDDFAERSGYYAITDGKTKKKIMNSYYYTYMNKASYLVEMVGTTKDGKEVILKSQRVVDAIAVSDADTEKTYTFNGASYPKYDKWTHKATFIAEDNWEYPLLTIRVIREGSEKSISQEYSVSDITNRIGNADTNGVIHNFRLPRYSTKDISVKLKLSTISKPSVSLARENGEFVTNTLAYDIGWSGLSKDVQLNDLGGYLITVKQSVPASAEAITKPHYYYVTDIENANVTDTIGLDIDKLSQDGVVIPVQDKDYQKTGSNHNVCVDLSDFYTGDVVEISVKAIARKNAEYYEDGEDGVENEITIPNRMVVPDVNKLSVVSQGDNAGMPTFESAKATKVNTSKADEVIENAVNMETYKKGVSIQYAISDDQQDVTNYHNETSAKISAAIAVFDTIPDGALEDKTAGNGMDAEESEDGTGCWNTGATKTLYSKADSLNMDNASIKNILNIDLVKYETYPGEFAGKWLKVALQATSTSRINSQWSDQDATDKTINYKWIHIPKLLVEDVDLKEMDSTAVEDELKDVARYYYDGQLHDENISGGKGSVIVRTKTLTFSEDAIADRYELYLVGKSYEITEPVATESDGKNAEENLENNSEEGENPVVTKTVTPTYAFTLTKHCKVKDDPSTKDGTWDLYYGEELLGNVGKTAELQDTPQIIEIPQYSNNDEGYALNAQLRYVEGEKSGTFQIVLPDLISIDETNYMNNSDHYITMKVMVTKKLSENATAYTAGNAAVFARESKKKLDDFEWSTIVKVMDAEDTKLWYNNNIIANRKEDE